MKQVKINLRAEKFYIARPFYISINFYVLAQLAMLN